MVQLILMEENQSDVKKAYRKMPIWQWILIYAVIGIVVYGLIYYFVLAKKGVEGPYPLTDQNTGKDQVQTQPGISEQEPSTDSELQTIVALTNVGFTPQTVTVQAGTKVTWTNNSGGNATVNSSVHPSHQDYPPLNLGEFEDGQTLFLVFDTPGTYKYHDHLNPSWTGTVVVE